MASKFLENLNRSGNCRELVDMCSTFIFFVDNFSSYETVGDLCPETCGLCPGKYF
jgi:hypothetical protein